MGHPRTVGPGRRGGGGIPAIRATPYGLKLGVAPFIVAAAIGGADAVAGLGATSSRTAAGVLVLALLMTVVAAGVLAAAVRRQSRRGVTLGVLGIGTTYGAVIAGHRSGPLTAGFAGLALLALAQLCHFDLARARGLTTRAGSRGWRAALGVAVLSAALDAVAALVAGGGPARPGSPSTASVLVGCLVVVTVVTGLTALADGAVLPTRREPEEPQARSAL